jgi:hypothetical protein
MAEAVCIVVVVLMIENTLCRLIYQINNSQLFKMHSIFTWIHGPPRNLFESDRFLQRAFQRNGWECLLEDADADCPTICSTIETLHETTKLPCTALILSYIGFSQASIDIASSSSLMTQVLSLVREWESFGTWSSLVSLWTTTTTTRPHYFVPDCTMKRLNIPMTMGRRWWDDPRDIDRDRDDDEEDRRRPRRQLCLVGDMTDTTRSKNISQALESITRRWSIVVLLWRLVSRMSSSSSSSLSVTLDWVRDAFQKQMAKKRKHDDAQTTWSPWHELVVHLIRAKMNCYLFASSSSSSSLADDANGAFLIKQVGSRDRLWISRAYWKAHEATPSMLVAHCTKKK